MILVFFKNSQIITFAKRSCKCRGRWEVWQTQPPLWLDARMPCGFWVLSQNVLRCHGKCLSSHWPRRRSLLLSAMHTRQLLGWELQGKFGGLLHIGSSRTIHFFTFNYAFKNWQWLFDCLSFSLSQHVYLQISRYYRKPICLQYSGCPRKLPL